MNKLVRRYIILSLAILIPILAAVLVGSYGYNSDRFGQGAWLDEYTVQQLTPEEGSATTEERIKKYMSYGLNNQYHSYDETPLVNKEIKNEDGKKLFDLLVYRSLYLFQEKDRFQYIYFIYNVEYQNIRDMYLVDPHLKEEINELNIPVISGSLTEIREDEEDSRPVTIIKVPEENFPVTDVGADYRTKSGIPKEEFDSLEVGDSLVRVIGGVARFTEISTTTSFKLEFSAKVEGIPEDANTINIYTEDVEIITNPEQVDDSNYLASFQQDLTASPDYFGWVFKKYLWWIGLITFLVIGLITGSFYLVYRSEEKRIAQEAAKNRRRKR